MPTDIWLVDFACHDASCAPPPVGTGGSRPGPSKGHLSPVGSERKNPPVAKVAKIYDLRHSMRETLDGDIGRGVSIVNVDEQWLGDDKGWFVSGSLKIGDDSNAAYFERYFHMDNDGKLVATHEVLQVQDQYQGKGYAQAFNDHLVKWYNETGFDRIEVTAGLEVGPYAWATQGYRLRGVQGGHNRQRWVADRLTRIDQVNGIMTNSDPDLKERVRALRKASEAGEDIQPIHVASLGQDDPKLHWRDPNFGDMWPGKAVLVEKNYHGSDDRSREWDGVYYLGS